MRTLFRQIRKLRFEYTPLVQILIFKQRLLHNLTLYRSAERNLEIAPVLKSNAYGHGLIQIAKILENERLPFLVVDSYHEALTLRNEGVRTKILIIGYTLPENIFRSRLKDVSFTLASTDEIKIISKNLKSQKNFHIKFDTGMHRQGIAPEELNEVASELKSNSFLVIEGVCSHLADSDENEDFTKQQIGKWNEITQRMKNDFPSILYFHLGATGSFPYKKEINANCMRLGLGLYGIETKPTGLELKPVLEMRSVISSEKMLKKGERVGYGLTFEAKEDVRLAMVSAGYFEGIDRRLSNVGFFKYRDLFVPIAGRISMNISTVDMSLVTDRNSLQGKPIVLISSNKTDNNSIENIAKLCDTIPHEILVHIPEKIRRIVVE